MKFLAPVKLFDHLVETGIPDVSHILHDLHTYAQWDYIRNELKYKWDKSLDVEAKLERAKEILDKRTGLEKEGEDEEDEENRIDIGLASKNSEGKSKNF